MKSFGSCKITETAGNFLSVNSPQSPGHAQSNVANKEISDLSGLVTSWVPSNNQSSFVQVSLCYVRLRLMITLQCQTIGPLGLSPSPPRGQKQEKSYCDYLKKSVMTPNRRGPKFSILYMTYLNPKFYTIVVLWTLNKSNIISSKVLTISRWQRVKSTYLMLQSSHWRWM